MVSVQPRVNAAGLGWPQTFDVGREPSGDATWGGRDGDGAWSGSQCLFAHSLRKFSMRDWGIEQKWMSILLPLLLLYNGRPFLPRGPPPHRELEGIPGAMGP